ncbi:MAG: translesion error-prone DNA polymerase V autoproteolytic subunit [Candidatus Babeliaceae bacterium]|nr:translesion error-prone DNA polymerase V autoproteolytic subunit [Candidatus Babeliaceae bacterium]
MKKIPFLINPAHAGFPSPAQDFTELPLDLNKYLVKHPAATFLVRVSGDSMVGAGIHSGDILIVDRALSVVSGNIIVAILMGEFTIKYYRQKKDSVILSSANNNYEDIHVTPEMDFEIWGIVTCVLHKV